MPYWFIMGVYVLFICLCRGPLTGTTQGVGLLPPYPV